MRIGIPTKKIHEITKIDYWFLHRLQDIVNVGESISNNCIESLRKAKMFGFSDKQIGKFKFEKQF